MGLFWLVMGHVFHKISYVDCDVDCDMDSYMPGGGGMLTTDIEASRWSNIYIYVYDYMYVHIYIYREWYQQTTAWVLMQLWGLGGVARDSSGAAEGGERAERAWGSSWLSKKKCKLCKPWKLSGWNVYNISLKSDEHMMKAWLKHNY